jgi:hypothetical protein
MESSMVAEPFPATPGCVFLLMGRFADRVQDRLAVCSARTTKDKLSEAGGRF